MKKISFPADIEQETDEMIRSGMREQAEIAIETADVIIFLVDVRQGLVDADFNVADMLRRSKKPVVLAVNKVDDFKQLQADVYEFYNLGIGFWEHEKAGWACL